MKEYEYFWCPGCSNYRHKDVENIVRVAHMTNRINRHNDTKKFYTTALSFLCDICISKSKEGNNEKTKSDNADMS
jgi:hypothetical protein